VDAAELAFLSATELRAAFARRELSPVEVTSALLARIDALDGDLCAFLTTSRDVALEAARHAEAVYARQGDGDAALLGVPLSVKDTILTRGVRTTMGSLLHESWVPQMDAPVVERARAAGAVLLGKTNAPEFSWKGDSGNRLSGPARNPWDTERTAGGSSGGAGAAVASGLGPLGIGSDTAGSTRIPAAFCGVVGLKPSFGLIPVGPAGGIETLSHIGLVTRTVADAALALDALAGPHPLDRLSLPADGAGLAAAAAGEVRGLRAGWSATLGYAPVEPEVAASAEAAALALEELGVTVEPLELELDDPYEAVHTLLVAGAAGGHRADFDEVRDRLDPERVPWVEEGFRLRAADVGAALIRRARWVERFQAQTKHVDLVLTPAVPVTAFAAGDPGPGTVAGEPRPGLSWASFGYPFNLTGQPAVTVPCEPVGGLPAGLQIAGRPRDDATVLRAAAAFEAARPWRDRRPAL
jgi:aspartyl-tRNA(Asn)/glutamyl-tRNA(Gln) amidotransferase subunit A